MAFLPEKSPFRAYAASRAVRYALGFLTFLLVLLHWRGYKSISVRTTTILRHTDTTAAVVDEQVQKEQVSQAVKNLIWTERNLTDGSTRYDSKGSTSNQTSLLVLSIIYDESFWGTTYDFSRARTEEDHLDLIAGQVNLRETAVGFMTASKFVYERLINATSTRDIGRSTIIYRKSGNTYAIGDRHRDEIQYERRSNLAIVRNNLMTRALQDEQHVFWLDSDVIDMTPKMIPTMIERAESNKEEIGMITARSDLIGSPNYDRNAWSIDRTVKGMLLAVPEEEREHVNHRLLDTRRYIPDLTRGLKGDQLGRLDSVGGTSLYIRADLIRNGVNFPPYKIIGTTWGQDGWTGQETEGICYIAKRTSGVNCWALGENHFTTHATNS